MPAALRIVHDVGICQFCWRSLPVEDLHEGGEPGERFCNDLDACVVEFRRWEQTGAWGTHPAYEVAV